MVVVRGFGSMIVCRSTTQLRHFSSNPFVFITILHNSILPKPSFCDAIYKVIGARPTTGPFYEVQRFSIGGYFYIHSSPFPNTIEKGIESTGDTRVTEVSGDDKVKRKKLKGKRAVVKWLKSFRWKKKKEYERMTAEEKILYKLRKV